MKSSFRILLVGFVLLSVKVPELVWAKNLTVLIGENEPKKNSGYQDLINDLMGYKHIKVKIIPNFGHGKMSDNRFLHETGPEVLTGCNF